MLLSYARSSSTHLVIHFTALLTGLEVPSLRPDSALSDSLLGGDIAPSFSEHAIPIPQVLKAEYRQDLTQQQICTCRPWLPPLGLWREKRKERRMCGSWGKREEQRGVLGGCWMSLYLTFTFRPSNKVAQTHPLKYIQLVDGSIRHVLAVWRAEGSCEVCGELLV